MPSTHFLYINIALDTFALLITLVLFAACFQEATSKQTRRAKYFIFLLAAIMVALLADIASWLGEGRPNLFYVTVISNTLASCAAQFAIICFMGYLKENLYETSRAATFTLNLFRVLCGLSILFSLGNTFWGYAFSVNAEGHWHHTENVAMGVVYFLFPVLSFFAIVLMTIFARSSTKVSRIAFIIYTLFPVAGMILDYIVHGLSLTYVGLTVSALVIYTSVYLKKQKLIEAQRNALMLSQINPHFVYNTLSTIAAMCDTSPKQAKYLTIDFAQYLRRNINTLTSEELIPFEQEIDHVACYLKIEQARFRERLNVIYSIQCKDFSVPPLTVQPLVENAVKHGITKKASGGTIKISTFEEDNDYVVEIIDDGVGFSTENTEMHVGIENAKSRVAAMCKGNVTIKSTLGVGTRVTIEIPKKKGSWQ